MLFMSKFYYFYSNASENFMYAFFSKVPGFIDKVF